MVKFWDCYRIQSPLSQTHPILGHTYLLSSSQARRAHILSSSQARRAHILSSRGGRTERNGTPWNRTLTNISIDISVTKTCFTIVVELVVVLVKIVVVVVVDVVEVVVVYKYVSLLVD